MSQSNTFSCVISGSFANKPLIDSYHRQFSLLGVDVLEPPLGPVHGGRSYAPPDAPDRRPHTQEDRWVQPLENEVGLTIRQIEDRFLRAIGRASFMYLVTVDGYVGPSAMLELGFARGHGVPLYASERPVAPADEWPRIQELFDHWPQVAQPAGVVADMQAERPGLWLPASALEYDPIVAAHDGPLL